MGIGAYGPGPPSERPKHMEWAWDEDIVFSIKFSFKVWKKKRNLCV